MPNDNLTWRQREAAKEMSGSEALTRPLEEWAEEYFQFGRTPESDKTLLNLIEALLEREHRILVENEPEGLDGEKSA